MRTLVFLATAAMLAGGCANDTGSVRESVEKTADVMQTGPKKLPTKSITGFSSALNCMDKTMLMYGIRNVVVISEDIKDETKKVSAGAKDMLISAVSRMTQRSRAIRLIAYGADSGNLIGFMGQSENKNVYQLHPHFGIRGSISQFDENIVKESAGGGLSWGGFWDKSNVAAGVANGAGVSILGMDLTMMSTSDLTIIPGVTSSNTVAIVQSNSGVDAEATFSKFGIGFKMSLTQTEGKAQALRNLVDLATIELFGKLTKTPYWACLGGSTNSPTVKEEIESWYYSLFADKDTFIAYWQEQMQLRGLYGKEINGVADNELRRAVEIYRQALGLQKNARLDLPFFTAYLGADHYKVMRKAKALLAGPPQEAPPQSSSHKASPGNRTARAGQ
jgi:hypothetical protein